MEIKIRSTQFIKPSKPTPENLRHFKLSLLDQLAPPSYIKPIFYYKNNDKVSISERCGQLANSLSEVLNLYYPLAGRLTEDGLEVDCNDQGVKFLVAQVSTTLDDFLNNISQLIIGAKDQDKAWLVTVQVNVFACGALVIGVSASHHVTDGCNLVRFINQWASMNRSEGGDNGSFAPSFDNLDRMFPPTNNSILEDSSSSVIEKKDRMIVTKRFRFNANSISKLRAKTGSHSRVTLVTSLIWKTLIAIDQVKCGNIVRNCLLVLAMNLRGKASSPVSKTSFGNVWSPYPIWFLHKENKCEFGDVVALIEDTTRDVIMRLQKASGEEICRHAKACYALFYEKVKQNKFSVFTSWCRFPMYEVDFGWGKPDWVSVGQSGVELVTLMDDKDGDGIEAWVSLNPKDMYVFEQDHDILDFTS